MDSNLIMILGVGNILMTDEGFGIRVIEELEKRYEFPENVSVVDGGVLGVSLMGVISEADRLIVVDAVRNQNPPGTMYRIEHDEIPNRILAKNSVHQIDFLETLTLCQALDKVPQTLILGIEPQDIDTLSIELTPVIKEKIDRMICLVLKELDDLGISYNKRSGDYVPRDTFKDCDY